MAIDSTVAELRYARGLMAFYYDRDAFAAERMIGSALRTSPGLPLSTSYYPAVLSAASTFFLSMGDLVTAEAYCDRLVELHEGEWCSADIAGARGQPDKAIDVHRRAVADQDPRALLGARASLVGALAKAGRLTDAKALAEQTETEANASQRYVREDIIAIMWARIGDNDRALRWFERALRSGSAGIGWLYGSIADTPLRHDPRVLALAKRAGLPDPPPYWR